MIDLDQAREIARVALEPGVTLYDEPIAARPYGWGFAYQSSAFLQSGNLGDMLAGNAPILVLTDGRMIDLGTAFPVEDYLATYERYGDPHLVPGDRVELQAAGLQTVHVIKAIRASSGLGLAETKRGVEAATLDAPLIIQTQSVEAAAELVSTLTALGADAIQLCK